MRATAQLLAILTIFPFVASAQFNTTLAPKAAVAFEKDRLTVETQLSGRPRYAQLKPGEMKVEPVRSEGSTPIASGLINDWVAATVVRGITSAEAIGLLQNYAAYKTIYSPDVLDSRTISHTGNEWHMYLQMLKKKVFTVVMNGEFDVEYRDLGEGRWIVLSRSTRLAEKDGEKELPVGNGLGFVWRLNTYWLIEPRPEGVYLECRSVSLSRDIPFGLGFAVKPFVTGVPPESLRQTMTATVKALQSQSQVR